MTREGRLKRIQEKLAAYEQSGPKRETLPLPWRGTTELFPVIQIEVDVPLLNAKSHRLQAKLEDHPQRQTVRDAPWDPPAQNLISEVLKQRHANYATLKENLGIEGQRDPGVITREGVLLNANTRAVALRELEDGGHRWIRVAVLPPDASPQELAELELALQVQDPLKDDYRLTEELLFIEELVRDYHKTEREIALDLRWASREARSARRGEAEVQQRRRILALIREMQRVTKPPIPLTFFDDKLEQLRALEKEYYKRLDDDPSGARRYRDNWLAASLGGAASVHDLRAVDDEFVSYLRPRLEEDKNLGEKTDELLAATPDGRNGRKPTGVDELADDEAGDDEPDDDSGDVKQVLNLLAEGLVDGQSTVTLPGSGEIIDREDFQNSIKQAVKGAVKDRKAQAKAADKLDEPVAQLREAVRLMGKAEASYRGVRRAAKFDQAHRGQFSYQLKKARKQLAKIEDLEAEA